MRLLLVRPADPRFLHRAQSDTERHFPQSPTRKPIAQLAGQECADDKRKVQGQEIVTPRTERELMDDRFPIGRGEDRTLCHDGLPHPDKADCG